MTPLKAIRQKCLDCCYDDRSYVRDCKDEKCPLWEYRMGHNPNRKGLGKKKQPQQAETEQNGFSYINTFGFQIGSNLAGQQAKINVKQQDNEQEDK